MSERERQKTSVLFVCMGNICRSPTAEGVFRHLVAEAGLAPAFDIDSAGVIDHHEGDVPDRRSQRHARARGYDLSSLVARAVRDDDFVRFDHVLAMDRDNLAALHRRCPAALRHKVRLFLSLLPADERGEGDEVPDPYYGGPDGFERVLDLCERASRALLDELTATRAG